jgi:hypothetical protein
MRYEGHYASMVQKASLAVAQAVFGARFKTYRSTPMLQLQPSDLPVLGIYILRERRTPNGHANHAQPKFIDEIRLGFSMGIQAETADQNHIYQLEEWMTELETSLLTNAKWVQLTDGIEGMDRASQYAKVGETTLFEIRDELWFFTQSEFPPKVDDWLEKVVVDTQFPDKAHVDSGTPQIHREYDLAIS